MKYYARLVWPWIYSPFTSCLEDLEDYKANWNLFKILIAYA